jgi:hypothetical protein
MKTQDRGDFIKRWNWNGFTLWLFQTGRRKNTGQEILRYVFKDGSATIFEGSEYGCSPLHALDSIECVYGLLGFLAMGKDGVDADYFKDYTPAQIAWRDSPRREELDLRVNDFVGT